MSGHEMADRLSRLVDWAEDVMENGDRDPNGRPRHVDTQDLLEEVLSQIDLIAGHGQEDRVPLIYRAKELDQ